MRTKSRTKPVKDILHRLNVTVTTDCHALLAKLAALNDRSIASQMRWLARQEGLRAGISDEHGRVLDSKDVRQ